MLRRGDAALQDSSPRLRGVPGLEPAVEPAPPAYILVLFLCMCCVLFRVSDLGFRVLVLFFCIRRVLLILWVIRFFVGGGLGFRVAGYSMFWGFGSLLSFSICGGVL